MRLVLHLGIILLQAFCQGSYTVPSNIVPYWPGSRDSYPYKNAHIPSREEVCNSEECQHFAAVFGASINRKIAACDDFYEHACGGWLSHIDLHGRATVNQYTQTRQIVYATIRNALTNEDHTKLRPSQLRAKLYYLSCVNADTGINETDELKNMINDNGGWPLIGEFGKSGNWRQWIDVHERYARQADIAALFRIGVEVDRKNSSRRIIMISAPESSKYDSEENGGSTKRRVSIPDEPYHKYIYDVATFLYGKTMDESRMESMNDEIRRIIEFQNELSKLSDVGADVDFDDENVHYDMMSMEELQNIWYDNTICRYTWMLRYKIDWFETIQAAFKDTSITVDRTEAVALVPGKYIRDLAKLLVSVDEETVVNYINWNAIRHLVKYTGREMRQIRDRYISAIFGTNTTEPRWLTCIDDMKLEHVISARMGHNDDFRKDQIYIRDMTNEIWIELATEIIRSPWLNPMDKIRTVRKVTSLVNSTGYPEWSLDPDLVDKYYEQLAVNAEHYFANALNVRVYLMTKELDKLRKPVDKQNPDWNIRHMDFVASYDDRTNNMMIPAGVLEHPYIRFNQLPAIKWGALGSLVGHKMAHSIDNIGRLYDQYNNKRKWWSLESIEKFKTVERCFVEKYNAYGITLSNGETIQLDGTRTLRENIADRLGFVMGFRAFKKFINPTKVIVEIDGVTNYTQEELYFYSLAQSRCEKSTDEYLRNIYAADVRPPSKIRINGALTGMREFSESFNCKSGDRMYQRDKQCSIWR